MDMSTEDTLLALAELNTSLEVLNKIHCLCELQRN